MAHKPSAGTSELTQESTALHFLNTGTLLAEWPASGTPIGNVEA
jgi:hypothetical protein